MSAWVEDRVVPTGEAWLVVSHEAAVARAVPGRTRGISDILWERVNARVPLGTREVAVKFVKAVRRDKRYLVVAVCGGAGIAYLAARMVISGGLTYLALTPNFIYNNYAQPVPQSRDSDIGDNGGSNRSNSCGVNEGHALSAPREAGADDADAAGAAAAPAGAVCVVCATWSFDCTAAPCGHGKQCAHCRVNPFAGRCLGCQADAALPPLVCATAVVRPSAPAVPAAPWHADARKGAAAAARLSA